MNCSTKRHPFAVAFLLLLAAMAEPARAQTVAVDIGHYLAEPGATSARGLPEFSFNRALGTRIADALTRAGLHPHLIGLAGDARDLGARSRQAQQVNAAFFLSVHHDSAKERLLKTWMVDGMERRYLDDRFRGFSLFVSRENPRLKESLTCASALGASLQQAGLKPSRYHADLELGEGRAFADEANGVHFFDHLAVLRRAKMPAMLLEAGVILNRDEELWLSDDSNREKIAQAVVAALQACLKTN